MQAFISTQNMDRVWNALNVAIYQEKAVAFIARSYIDVMPLIN